MEEAEYGYVLLSDEEEAEKIGLGVQTIKKYHRELIAEGYLEIIEIEGKKVKRYNLKKLTNR